MPTRRTPQKGDYIIVDNSSHTWKGRRGKIRRVGEDTHPDYALVDWAGAKKGEPVTWMWFKNIRVTRRPTKKK